LSEYEDFQPIRRSILTLCRYLNLVHQYLTLRLTGFTAL
jgi:hypothetical protein